MGMEESKALDYRNFDINFGAEGKTALITGAAAGIGQATAVMFARKGADIVCFDLQDAEETHEAVEKCGRRFLGIAGDITKDEDIKHAVETAVQEFGKIDILINCAGIGILEKVEEVHDDIWQKTFDVNLTGSFKMTQEVGKRMLESGGGKIVCIASQAGVVALDRHVAYGCTKAGIIQMVKQCALEWARYNININAISPTIILTALGEMNWNNPAGEAFKQTIPARRFGYPEEVAACAVYLASDAASLINGANIVIDGGFTIG